jgi:hypothetical protein
MQSIVEAQKQKNPRQIPPDPNLEARNAGETKCAKSILAVDIQRKMYDGRGIDRDKKNMH